MPCLPEGENRASPAMAAGRLFATNDIEACWGEREALRAFWLAAGDRALNPCLAVGGLGSRRQKKPPPEAGAMESDGSNDPAIRQCDQP